MKKEFSSLVVAVISILTMACNQPVNFNLPPTSNNFGQSISYNNKVDILWIVDNSSSMLQHQESLNAQIPALVDKLNSLKMDYHIAVVTTSMGGTNPNGGRFIGTPPFITSATPDLLKSLSARMVIGENGSDNERGLESMEMALSANSPSSEGAGFLRSDALLVVTALSDEDDKTAASNPSEHYVNFLDSLKKPWADGSRSWLFNFIGVLSNSPNCRTFNDYSEPGLLFIDISKASGGVQESICNVDLSQAVSNIHARIAQILTDFKLSKKPLVQSITVTINGHSIPRSNVNGWDYIDALNVIRFYGSAVPPADASIKVDFKPTEAN
ncbi:MAG: hypothetical protein ACXVCY_02225 [Pseudobdellovibrionaceae bacterium]